MNRQDLYFTPESFKGKAPDAVKLREPIHLNGKADFNEGDGAINHFRNYVQSILGNEKPIGMTIEQWFSPELGVIVSKTNQGTTGGGASYRLDHIVQGEPDPGLFVVPADYTLHRGPVASN